jgi:ABC-2 type transport system ATP-binding protein
MDQILIQAQKLTFSYGERIAVDGVSFEVNAGEIFGFLGPNGAGKTTVVRLLTGQLHPSSGTAVVLGRDVSRFSAQVRPQMGVAFETANLYEQLSALENLRLFARLFNIRQFDPMPLLEKVGLAGRERDRVANYSKGMKQRLMLARALVNRPRVLFLDEPTEGLDPLSSQTIHRIIREAANQGAAVFLTTHDMVEADRLSQRVAFINQGKIAALDKPALLKRQFGKRMLKAELENQAGKSTTVTIPLDAPDAAQKAQTLFSEGRVVTMHTEEATLEDIFIQLTGTGLAG